MKKVIGVLLVAVAVVLVVQGAGWGLLFDKIAVQGKLTNTDGTAVANGTYNFKVKYWQDQILGDPIQVGASAYSINNVQVTNGLFKMDVPTPAQHFKTILDSNGYTNMRMEIFFGATSLGQQAIWPVPFAHYARYAGFADSAKNLELPYKAMDSKNGALFTIINTDYTSAAAIALETIGNRIGSWNMSAGYNGVGIGTIGHNGADPTAAGFKPAQQIGVYGASAGIGVVGGGQNLSFSAATLITSEATIGVMGSGRMAGVAGTSTQNSGVAGVGNTYGVSGASTAGIGVGGASVNNYGVYGLSSNNIGVKGEGKTYGGRFTVSFTEVNGIGVYGSGGSAGVSGMGENYGVKGSGTNYGGYFSSTTGAGIRASGEINEIYSDTTCAITGKIKGNAAAAPSSFGGATFNSEAVSLGLGGTGWDVWVNDDMAVKDLLSCGQLVGNGRSGSKFGVNFSPTCLVMGSATDTGNAWEAYVINDLGVGGTFGADYIKYNNLAAFSDLKLKTNIEKMKGVLDKLQGIDAVKFTWKDEAQKKLNMPKGRQIGLVAQDVEKQFPELVITDKNTGYKSLQYDKLTAVLLEAVKELKAQNEKLEARVKTLENK